jgi:hypothetical protein
MNVAKKLFWMSGAWAPAAVVETIVARDYPVEYLPAPVKATQLTSKVGGATIEMVSQNYPLTVIKKGKANILKSKFSA